MNLPGSYQLGLGSKLLREYSWWKFTPHPEWVSPRGTTLLEPEKHTTGFDIDLIAALSRENPPQDADLPLGEWQQRRGDLRLPYAAGAPGDTRVIYLPYFGFRQQDPPTVLGLDEGVTYTAYYWDPSLGIRFDLGDIERPKPGEAIYQKVFGADEERWSYSGAATVEDGKLVTNGALLATLKAPSSSNLVASVAIRSTSDAGLIFRFSDEGNFTSVNYSARRRAIYILERLDGKDGRVLGETPVERLDQIATLTAEVRNGKAIVSISDGSSIYTSPIVAIDNDKEGRVGVIHRDPTAQMFSRFELRRSPSLKRDSARRGKVYDARGVYRGDLSSQPPPDPGHAVPVRSSRDYGVDKAILLDAYQPERLPYVRDWVLVLQVSRPNKDIEKGISR